MIRTIAALATVALLSSTAMAQETLPADAPPPPAGDITIDPAASVDSTPRSANMLTGFYATKAVIEICALEIEPDVLAGMEADRARLETSLSMDAATAGNAYTQVKADVEKTTPDCAEGSTDRISVDAVTAIYKSQIAAGTQTPGAAPADPATPAAPAEPATPAAPAAPAEPATPAQ
ncbi:MAG: hypothetical protein P0Y65_17980 [Candidatus Devosia phytovorans]|uniref:Uncharacterized protein n=1 Tax=Candidatus Devosia phytovorans TaxID=3121372 RepID=A0AAJ5VTT1_9HYPH|nr:hypothetical protein [Devosia sp.]WEK04051.1 MAG: hypothetical protein P0Y65_17980 [Devosia sp.]